MSYLVEIKEEALEDISLAYRYYEEQKSGLGEEFMTQLDSRIITGL